MGLVRSSVKGWKTAATGLAVLIVIVLQVLGLGVGWPQEPAEPRVDEEIAKQEKIYRSQGADVPGGYVTNRGLSDYLELLPSGFCDALGSLRQLGPMAGYRSGLRAGDTGLLRTRR